MQYLSRWFDTVLSNGHLFVFESRAVWVPWNAYNIQFTTKSGCTDYSMTQMRKNTLSCVAGQDWRCHFVIYSAQKYFMPLHMCKLRSSEKRLLNPLHQCRCGFRIYVNNMSPLGIGWNEILTWAKISRFYNYSWTICSFKCHLLNPFLVKHGTPFLWFYTYVSVNKLTCIFKYK